MNGVHDLGGMHGFGTIPRERDEPVFHAPWERRTFALASATFGAADVNVDEFRHSIERIAPATYLASTYYERWLRAIETLLVEKGVLRAGEIESRIRRRATLKPARRRANPARSAGQGLIAPSAPPIGPRFSQGDRVRARNLNPAGHTRLPRYVRGRRGVIETVRDAQVLPDRNAHHLGRTPQYVYSVAFDSRELWGDSASRDRLYIDLWEDYLEPL